MFLQIACETAGAARTRSSLRPRISRANEMQNFGQIMPREREIVSIVRRPCERRDPYRVIWRWDAVAVDRSHNNCRGVWVPVSERPVMMGVGGKPLGPWRMTP